MSETRAEKLRRIESLDREIADERTRQIQRAQVDFAAFCEYVLRDEATGERIQLGNLHLMWIRFMALAWRLGLFPWVLAPFGSGKTNILVIALTLFLLGRDTRARIKVISANDTTAMQRVAAIRQYIEESEAYHEVFPHVVKHPTEEWTKHTLFVARPTIGAKDPSVEGVGIETGRMGSRSDCNIYDDLNDPKNTLHEPKTRDKNWTNYKMFHSRLEPNAVGVGVMTRWHDEDTFGLITKERKMLRRYAFLIQAISDTMDSLECEILLGKSLEGLDQERTGRISVLQTALKLHERGLMAA